MGTSDPGLCSNSKHEDADTCHHSRLFVTLLPTLRGSALRENFNYGFRFWFCFSVQVWFYLAPLSSPSLHFRFGNESRC